MAKFTSGTTTGPGGCYDFMTKLRDHMIANGWTVLHTYNSSPGSIDFVIRGQPLDPVADNYPILRFIQSTSTQFFVRACADFDPSTNETIFEAGSTNARSLCPDSSAPYWIRANGVAVAWAIKNGTDIVKNYAGFVRRGLTPGMAGLTKTTAAVEAGATSLPVASSMVGKLRVGQRVMIRNFAHDNSSVNKNNGETVTVTSISAGSIGVTATTRAYDAGAVVGSRAFTTICAQSADSNLHVYPCGSSAGSAVWSPFNLTGANAAGAVAESRSMVANVIASEGDVDPDDVLQEYVGGVWSVTRTASGASGIAGWLYHWECASSGPGLEDVFDEGNGFTHIVLAGGSGYSVTLGPRED